MSDKHHKGHKPHTPETPADPPESKARPVAPPQGDIRVVDRRWWARAESEAAAASADAASDKPAYVQELEQRLAARDEELRATLTKYREAASDFDQSRLRMKSELGKEIERSRRAMLADLLEVVDNLERAIESGRQASGAEALVQGVEMVRAQFLAKLDGLGVRRVEAIGARFDPALHEAATTVPASNPAEDGMVVGVIRPGYTIGDDVLRPAVVAVARLTSGGAS